MSVSNDITIMVDRLKRADIPLDNLCYELDETEWRELIRYVEGFARYAGNDLSYVDEITYMGLLVRKRASLEKLLQVR